MNYAAISPQDARNFSEFVLPTLKDDTDWDNYSFFIAYDDENSVKGMAVCDFPIDRASLLSIAVSPDEEGKGTAEGLISQAVSEARMLLDPLLEQGDIPFTASATMESKYWGRLAGLLEKTGFKKVTSVPSITCELGEIAASDILAKAEGRRNAGDFISLKKIDKKLVKEFGNKVANENLYGGITGLGLDEDTSLFYLKDGKIAGCILMKKISDKEYQNEWVYLDPAVNDRSVLLSLFAECLNAGKEKLDPETRINFLPVEDVSKKLLDSLIDKPLYDVEYRVYERMLSMQENRFDDMELDQITEADMVCKDCKFSTGCTGECAKYAVKPGTVMYGGECSLFEKA